MIKPENSEIARCAASFSDDDLKAAYLEIVNCRAQGTLRQNAAFGSVNDLRVTEDAVLMELSRRYVNELSKRAAIFSPDPGDEIWHSSDSGTTPVKGTVLNISGDGVILVEFSDSIDKFDRSAIGSALFASKEEALAVYSGV